VKHIFASLSVAATVLLVAAFVLGLMVEDPKAGTPEAVAQFQYHFLAGSAGLVFAALVHAIVLTYFMGTGRWIEETSEAYRLDPSLRAQNQSLKYRAVSGMGTCLLLLIATGAFGAAADPASPVGFRGWFGLSPTAIHFTVAAATLCANALVNFWEFQAIDRNGEIVNAVLADVRRIRQEKGLPV
jgi:hypothetical protein